MNKNFNKVKRVNIEKEDQEEQFCWKKTYRNKDIVAFHISSGDRPIVNIEYDGSNLRYYNRINGSRDGWMLFPKDYFDEHNHRLTYAEKVRLLQCINNIEIESWKTYEAIKDNYLQRADGFCVENGFECVFGDGNIFKFLSYDIESSHDFNTLFSLLCNICGIEIEQTCQNNKSINTKFTEMNVCPECRMIIEKGTKYCAYCGVGLKKYSKLAECVAEFDFDYTMMSCPWCNTFNAMGNRYCKECGVEIKRTF